jgi:tRNA(Ile2) C34 agmatinyltransferase TiaS
VTTATLPERLFAPSGGDDATLDERVVAAIEDLARRGRARCLVCGGETAASGQCRDCGASLS